MIPIFLAVMLRLIPIDGQTVALVTDPADVARCERLGAVGAGKYRALHSDAAVDRKLAEEAVEEGGDTVLLTKRRTAYTTPKPRIMAWGRAYRCR